MKKSEHKGIIEEKISSKIHAIINELKIKKGHAISKSIEDASRKIAKVVARKMKALENEMEEIKDKILKRGTRSKPSVKVNKKITEKKVAQPKSKTPAIRVSNKRVVKTTAPKVASVAKSRKKAVAVSKLKPVVKKSEQPASSAPVSKVAKKPAGSARPKPTIKKVIPPVVKQASESVTEPALKDQNSPEK